MKVVKIAALTFVGLLLVVFAFMGYLYATRGTPTRTVKSFGDSAGPPAVTDSLFVRTVALLTRTNLAPGHTVEPLFNGNGTFPRIWNDLRSAKQTITIQLYYCKPGIVADSLKRILMERSSAGVRVFLLVDAFGCQHMSDEYQDSLRDAGVRVARFRPVQWFSLHKAQHRSHARLIGVDGGIGYTGGFGLADMWRGGGRATNEWRETNVRFTGPAVLQLQAAFFAAWAEATGELLTGASLFGVNASADTASGAIAGLLHAEPGLGSTAAERFLALTIAGARTTLFITNPYFVPDDDFRRMLIAAARRGVDVRVLTAGKKTDVPVVRLAGRRRYEELLRAGVRIYEYRPAMIHAKTIVADGVWSTIGTMNVDNRSLAVNEESNLLIVDRAVAATLYRHFHEDLRYAEEIRLTTFVKRSIAAKALERAASAFAKIL